MDHIGRGCYNDKMEEGFPPGKRPGYRALFLFVLVICLMLLFSDNKFLQIGDMEIQTRDLGGWLGLILIFTAPYFLQVWERTGHQMDLFVGSILAVYILVALGVLALVALGVLGFFSLAIDLLF